MGTTARSNRRTHDSGSDKGSRTIHRVEFTSHAAHGLSTDSIMGIGDGLIVSVASIGANYKNAWILRREIGRKRPMQMDPELAFRRHSIRNFLINAQFTR